MFTDKTLKDITSECVTKSTDCRDRYVIYYKTIPLCESLNNNDPKFVTGTKIEVIARSEDGKESEFFIEVTTPVLGKPNEAHHNILGRWYSRESIETWLGEPVTIEVDKYGYNWDGMTKLAYTEAIYRHINNKEVYLLYADNSESLVESVQDIKDHDGEFGFENR